VTWFEGIVPSAIAYGHPIETAELSTASNAGQAAVRILDAACHGRRHRKGPEGAPNSPPDRPVVLCMVLRKKSPTVGENSV